MVSGCSEQSSNNTPSLQDSGKMTSINQEISDVLSDIEMYKQKIVLAQKAYKRLLEKRSEMCLGNHAWTRVFDDDPYAQTTWSCSNCGLHK